MKRISYTIAAVAALSLAGVTASFSAELPTYEAAGLPISPVQVAVLGGSHVQGQAQASGNAATPHQLKVLTPRKLSTAAAVPGQTEGRAR
ncbi:MULTISPECIES: hypothetical protein [unclassified Bradyrhizobium]|uniref:hypothetical protein n=1 Tax=unclassified Bradyrhizobium TaxID=2631580 RepID=UPI0024784226|nr:MULTISPECIES: hypothetical protein [unclassified Bradyrhizobium]WGR68177.1 hypothetical protein MTX24_22280 [Bradyrhizobium sp. ISRA426]WGR80232.1 hypothetical protein MTX21_07395 [Bradyrhizobium sp. ISRA430]WGR83417.1 hypothetical protein MTX25_21960 [Bradyrhizobium sp. ISRA432]